ncbi:MAG TPA: tetratricopeptide repeat protein [Xanthomonadaceae bacterium]|nr:tetratricopeptide repeat protein [Xanthomonadaceae bacterium]
MRDWTASLRQGWAEFRRRRVFRVAGAYLVAGWILVQLGSATFEPLGLPAWSMRLLLVLLAVGFLLACTLAWTYDIGARGIERTAPANATEPPPFPPAPEASVAILPFADLSEAHDQDYFCDGLAEEILNALTRVRGLRVASRTSSFRFREGNTDAREIGRALSVAAIMEGSVRKSGERVRVTAQLIDAGNGYHLWSENFDRRLEDVFAIQEEIARNVVEALRVSLRTPDALDLQRYAPRDMRAYDFYLRGRRLEGAKDRIKWEASAQMYRRALALDPDYAQAHAGLADVLCELMLWRFARPADVLDEALAASRRALELALELAEAHVAHAHTLAFSGDDEAAAAEFTRAIELNPDLYEAHYYFARHCFARGQFARALDLFEAAHRVHPDEFQALMIGVGAAEALGDAARADDMARRGVAASLHCIELDPENARAHYGASALLQRLGEDAAAKEHAEMALHLRPNDYDTLYNCACYFALAGDSGRALDLLERAVATGQGFRDWIEHDHDLDSLRGLPRFRRIFARLEPRDAPAPP